MAIWFIFLEWPSIGGHINPSATAGTRRRRARPRRGNTTRHKDHSDAPNSGYQRNRKSRFTNYTSRQRVDVHYPDKDWKTDRQADTNVHASKTKTGREIPWVWLLSAIWSLVTEKKNRLLPFKTSPPLFPSSLLSPLPLPAPHLVLTWHLY